MTHDECVTKVMRRLVKRAFQGIGCDHPLIWTDWQPSATEDEYEATVVCSEPHRGAKLAAQTVRMPAVWLQECCLREAE